MAFFWTFTSENIKHHMFHIESIKKCFLKTKSALEWFLKADSDDWSNDWKFSFAITGINYVLKYITVLLHLIK